MRVYVCTGDDVMSQNCVSVCVWELMMMMKWAQQLWTSFVCIMKSVRCGQSRRDRVRTFSRVSIKRVNERTDVLHTYSRSVGCRSSIIGRHSISDFYTRTWTKMSNFNFETSRIKSAPMCRKPMQWCSARSVVIRCATSIVIICCSASRWPERETVWALNE